MEIELKSEENVSEFITLMNERFVDLYNTKIVYTDLNQEDKDDFYNSIYINLKHFLICVSILIIAMLPFVFNILIKNDYREAYYYIPIMVVSVYFSNMSNFCSGIFSAYKDTKILAKTALISALINFGIGLLLISKIGLYATALATTISYFIIYIYRNFKLKKYLILKKDKYQLLNILVLGVVTILYYTKNYLFALLALLIAIFYSYYLNKSLIKILIKKVLKIFKIKPKNNK